MEPMLAIDLKPGTPKFDTITNDPNYVMEPKLDGWRAILTVTPNKDISLVSRTGNDLLAKVPHMQAAISDDIAFLRPGFYDMELGVPVEGLTYAQINYNTTARVLGSFPQEAVRKANENHWIIHGFVFDYLFWGEHEYNTPYAHRKESLPFMPLPKYFKPVYDYGPYDEVVFNHMVENGGEGIMLKNLRSLYVPGKRPVNTWYKIKKFDTLDVYVVGAEYGEGKYFDTVGALVFDTNPYGFGIGKCSGMTDDERNEWANLIFVPGTASWCHEIDPIWRKIEIKYYGFVGKDKKGLRHPQYLKWKKPE